MTGSTNDNAAPSSSPQTEAAGGGGCTPLRFVPTEPVPPSNARLVAELQGLTLAIRMFGLDAINDGRVTMTQTQTGEAR